MLYLDKKIYSTDSKIISNYATKYGFEKRSLRPKKLSTDKTKIIDVLKYELVKESKYNNFK